MVGRGYQFDFLESKCSSCANHSYFFILGLVLFCTMLSSCVQEPRAVKCIQNITSIYQHCGIHQDGVQDLDCFGKTQNKIDCVWKPGKRASERTTYTLILQQPGRSYCKAYYNISETIIKKFKAYQNENLTAQVFEINESANCTKAVISVSPKSILRCGPPRNVSFRRHAGTLVMNVSWQREDIKDITNHSVKYKVLGSLPWIQSSSQSENGDNGIMQNLNSSLSYTVKIKCVENKNCPRCAWSEAYTVPSELTTKPVIVSLEDSDTAEGKGCRLLTLSWKFSAKELHDGFYVTVWKASGEAPCERISTTKPEIRLILSYSAYHLNISAVNNASTSPAVSQAIPQRQDMPSMGAGKLNVIVHSNTSFTISWKDNLIKKYVCYSVEWMRNGHKAVYMSFYQRKQNNRTLAPLPEALEPHKRYSITLHTRPDKDTCNMKRINNSESTYGSTQFYFTEASPLSGPANISSYNETLNSVVLQWSSIPEDKLRGFLLGYIIYLTEYHSRGASTERKITVDPELNSYELKGLKSSTAYQVQISGFTQTGEGERSKATSIFKTKDQGHFDVSGVIIIFAVVAAVLTFGSVIIKRYIASWSLSLSCHSFLTWLNIYISSPLPSLSRVKAIMWPSIPSPVNSDAVQKMEGPCVQELLESINTLRVEEWDTNSLQIVEKEVVIPACTLPSMLPLLHASEDERDSTEMTCGQIQRDTEDATGDIPPDVTAETLPNIPRTNPPISPFAFTSDYTTMEMFQQGMLQGVPANTSMQVMERELEDADTTVVKSGLNYI
ncbi:leukemia inhibitory factor receptor isoform X2 [Plectropomus leopardus]|uniref:leukemia inhibitory factor receptor isoform X2 n=1 Tax=Plectropomus leopardus TaxID=160734 RepID=UPI001C4B8627|nr:leukemia inhibitory factor receptor isoform X2 [Plectropomus leopardus]